MATLSLLSLPLAITIEMQYGLETEEKKGLIHVVRLLKLVKCKTVIIIYFIVYTGKQSQSSGSSDSAELQALNTRVAILIRLGTQYMISISTDHQQLDTVPWSSLGGMVDLGMCGLDARIRVRFRAWNYSHDWNMYWDMPLSPDLSCKGE
ncbi:uncharacterized protein LOC120016413 isoform X1 [Tripterygium wilfordii]|uniref:uncharacterized protein LOC120016413 isoform X1 n=1 Tax=Tripterygium wilfordii TaxID=458696 RepID=UPI0018F81AA3|nr:uncharacterized protein LOC120016413 isoform X1 [Tripterygium wilfordii]XP_038725105.1 uncharacterized protein LOC120016413 isoform X1 [Tripterygium wilfordii]